MKKLTLLSLVLLTLFACRKDVDETLTSTTTTPSPTVTTIDYEPEVVEVTATLFGEVVDESGTPVNNATVKLGNNNTSTDDKGRFLFKDITMNKLGTYVEVNKNGYFPGSNRFFPRDGSVNYVKITLLDKTNIGMFSSGDGATISSSEGISIAFPANGVVTTSGDLYQGTVDVAARWIDPTATNLFEIMPGNLQGIAAGANDSLEEMALASYGMIAIEIESNNGELLNLGNGKKATLSFPIPIELSGSAPAEIPLWYFSEEFGLWVQEGKAIRQGNVYIGEVAHFSFWNCDDPYTLLELSGTILSPSGSPVPNASVNLTMISTGVLGYGYTDSDGFFSGKVPIGEAFIMQVYPIWNCEAYNANIGPFTTDTDIGDITITSSQLIDITGTIVDCVGDAVTSGYIEFTVGTGFYNHYTYYIDNGNDISMSIFNCDNETDLSLVATNLDDLEQSDTLFYSISNPLDLGNIAACGNTLTEWLFIEADGVTTTFLDVGLNHTPGQDTFYLTANIPGTNYKVELFMAGVNGVGSYNNSNMEFSDIYLESSSGGFFFGNCGNWIGSACTFDNFDITVFGNVGDPVEGSFSGTLDFFDNNQMSVSHYIDASFTILRD